MVPSSPLSSKLKQLPFRSPWAQYSSRVFCYTIEGGDFLGYRPIIDDTPQPYEWLTYSRVQERVTHFGAGLTHLGLATQQNFGIFSINRPEWVN